MKKQLRSVKGVTSALCAITAIIYLLIVAFLPSLSGIHFVPQSSDQWHADANAYHVVISPQQLTLQAGKDTWSINWDRPGEIRPSSKALTLADIEQHTDLYLYDKGGAHLGYDLIIAPGGDPSAITLQFNNNEHQAYLADNGALILPVQEGALVHSAPIAYQDIEHVRVPIDSRFVLNNNVLSFDVGQYHPDYPLIIDPEVTFVPSVSNTLTLTTAGSSGHTLDMSMQFLCMNCPMIDVINNTVLCNTASYTLPAITGADLIDPAYYTDMNGGGTRYEAGDVAPISGTVTLYAYDKVVEYPVGGANLEALYTFEESNDDVSGNGNNPAAANPASIYSSDAQEGSFSNQFNGTSQELLFSNAQAPSFNAAFSERTIAMWIKPTDLNGVQMLFEQGWQVDGFALQLNGATVEAGIAHANSAASRFVARGPADLTLDGQWHHIAAVFDNGDLTVYIDGVAGTTEDTGTATVDAAAVSQAAGIARSNGFNAFGNATLSYYAGLIDDLRIIAAVEPPVIVCEDEESFTVSNTQLTLTPTVNCTNTTDFSVEVQLDYSGVNSGTETIEVTFQGNTMTHTPTAADGMAILTFTSNTPAFDQPIMASFTELANCSQTTSVSLIACSAACVGALGGTAWNDIDNDGAGPMGDDASETGAGNILVEIYPCDATTPALTTYTNANGEWSVDDAGISYPVRVEFSSPIDDALVASNAGPNNGTNTQFVDAASCDVNYGVYDSEEYCGNADVAVVCFTRNNDPVGDVTIVYQPNSTGREFVPLSATDNSRDWGVPQGGNTTNYPLVANEAANKGEMGTTLGLSWDQTHSKLLSSSFYRAYSSLGANTSSNSLGEAIIYEVPFTSGMADAPAVWLDLEDLLGDDIAGIAVTDPNWTQSAGRTGDAPNLVGYTGLGSMKIAADDSEVYVVNLNTREVLVIPIAADGSAPTNAADVKRFPLPDTPCSGNWPDGRPYNAALGLGVHPVSGRVYATMTCTGPDLANVTGYVYSFDPSDTTPASSDFQLEVTVPLDIDRPAGNPNGSVAFYGQIDHPWETVAANTQTYTNSAVSRVAQHIHPWLGEVAFDKDIDGNYAMIIGERNRHHDQIASSQLVAGGVMFLACGTEGNWQLESGGSCGSFTSGVNYSPDGTTGTAGDNVSDNNRFFKPVGKEGAMSAGMVTVIPGSMEVLMPSMDNVFNSGTSGLAWLSTQDGDRTRDSRLLGDFSGGGFNGVNFNKANNWGAAVPMCSAPVIEIGNYVWVDTDMDGTQDACEEPVSGVPVSLYNKATMMFDDLTTTDDDGEYYFDSLAQNTDYAIVFGYDHTSAATDGLWDNTTGELTVGLSVYELTDADSGEGNLPEYNDSDATLMDMAGLTQYPIISYTAADTTDHTLDVGLQLLRMTCPMIDAINDTVLCNTANYTLPAITGVDLIDPAYYTEMNGGGTRYEVGAMAPISSTVTLYAYDKAVEYPMGGANLEAHYTFEESNDDVSGNGNNPAAANPASTYSSDAQEGSFSNQFNGTSQELLFSNAQAPSFNAAFSERTIAVWIKPVDLDNTQVIFEQGNNANGFALQLNGATVEAGVANASTRVSAMGATDLALDGQWHHIAAVFDNGNLTVYIDGVAGTTVATGFASVGASVNQGAGIARTNLFNAFNTNVNTGYYAGLIDDLHIIAAVEPPVIICDDEQSFTVSNTTLTVTPTVSCMNDTEFSIEVQLDYTGVSFGTETIAVSFQGNTMSHTPTAADGMATLTFTANAPAFDQPITAAFTELANCEETTTVDLIACSSACTDGLGGMVWNDNNNDGTEDIATGDESGARNILVEIYECGATMPTLTTYTNENGEWTVDDAALTYPVRVEFSYPLQPELESSLAGTDNGTNTQFADAASCEIDHGVINPDEYCLANALMVVPCFVNGLSNSPEAPFDALVAFSYDASGATSVNRTLATKEEIGSTWGVAHNRETDEIYASAVLKRHVGLGESMGAANPLGAIYLHDLATEENSLFLDLSTLGVNVGTIVSNAARGLMGPAEHSTDAPAFTEVGKVGLGDIDISEDYSTLFVTSLADKQVHVIDIATKTITASHPLPTPCDPAEGEFRPFALKVWNNEVYVGGICDALLSQQSADLWAYIYRLDGSNFSPVLDFSLDYPKHPAWSAGNNCQNFPGWYPWLDVLAPICSGGRVISYPAPLLTDIEFTADSTMILGFVDRTAFQYGDNNNDPDGNELDLTYVLGGDILRAPLVNGQYMVETDAPGYTANSEFFNDTDISTHTEVSNGALAYLPGTDEIAMTGMNPFATITGGIYWMDLNDGGKERLYEVYNRADNGVDRTSYFGKGNGLGDIEIACDPPSIQIGNYVWIDTDMDGTQDACEGPVDGLMVTLFTKADDGTLTQVATTTTSATGEYYFTADGVTGETWDNSGDSILTDTSYVIAFGDLSGSTITLAGVEYELTDALSGEGNNPTLNDSDGVLFNVNGNMVPAICYMTSDTTDHTLDIGLTPNSSFDLALNKSLAAGQMGTVEVGDEVVFTITVYNQGTVGATNIDVTDYLPSNTTYSATSSTASGNLTSTMANTVALTNNGDGTFTLDALPGGDDVSFDIAITIGAGAVGTLTNNAEIVDADGGTDEDSPLTSIIGRSDDVTELATNDNIDDDGTGTPGTMDLAGDEDDYDLEQIMILIDCSISITNVSVNCANEDEFTVSFDVNWDYTDATVDMIEVTVDGDVQTPFTPGTAMGTQSIGPIMVTGPAYDLLLEANFLTNTTCTTSTTFDLIACGDPCTTGIGGTVWNDFDNDGAGPMSTDATETGQENIKVEVYDCDGNLACETWTNANGEWSCPSLTDNTQEYRVEFSTPLQGYLPPSYAGDDNGTDVQFVMGGAGCVVDYGVVNPADFCEDNPFVLIPCYMNGRSDGNTDAAIAQQRANSDSGNPTLSTYPVSIDQVGSVWGIAYAKQTNQLFSSAFIKRHVGLKDNNLDGEGDLGMIYVTDLTAGTTTSFIDLDQVPGIDVGSIGNDAARGLLASNQPSNDPTAFDKVGKEGLGDLEISEDGSTLYVVNLFERSLLVIDIATQNVTSIPFPAASCPSGELRPMAIGIHEGAVYLGAVCSGENGGSTADLSAAVYQLISGQIVEQLSFSLDYTRGRAYNAGALAATDHWEPWTADANLFFSKHLETNNSNSYPQPLLSDIDFTPDGEMILGFLDRGGHQAGHFNYSTTGTTLYQYIVAGELLIASKSGSGQWELESNGDKDGSGSYIPIAAQQNNQGPGGGEFFYEERFSVHEEVSMGGILSIPGKREVLMTGIDPFAFFTGGMYRFSTDNATRLSAYTLTTSLGKSNGLGDIEAVCSPPPIQIGNYVWADTDEDGVQDPCEEPIEGVLVSLYNKDTDMFEQVVTTGPNGEYYFNDVEENTNYAIVFGYDYTSTAMDGLWNATDGELSISGSTYTLTNADADGTNPLGPDANELNDSDASLMDMAGLTQYPIISYMTSDTTDHTLDMGLVPPPFDLALTKTLAAGQMGTVSVGDEAVFTITVYNQGTASATNIDVTDYLPSNTTYSATSSTASGNLTSTMTTTVALTNNGDGTFTLDALPGGDDVSFDIAITIGAGAVGTLTNNAEIVDADGGTDEDSPLTSIIGRSDDVTELATNDNIDDDGAGTPGTMDLAGDEDDYDLEQVTVDAVALTSIGSTVFVDNNNNAMQDIDDLGIADVEVLIYQVVGAQDGNGNTETDDILLDVGSDGDLATASDGMNHSTNASGDYLFQGLPTGDYYVVIAMDQFDTGEALADTQISSTDIATTIGDNQTDSDDNGQQAGAGQLVTSSVITLGIGTEPTDTGANPENGQAGTQDNTGGNLVDANGDMTVDFGFFAPVSLGDTTFVDTNMNGLQDAGEPPLEGVTVTLFASDGTPVTTDAEGNPLPGATPGQTTTDANGFYQFTNLPPGDYYVVFDITTAAGSDFFDFTINTGGDEANDSDADPTTGQTDNSGAIPSGGRVPDLDAGVVCNVSAEAGTGQTICSTATVDLTALGASFSPTGVTAADSTPFGATWTSSGNGTFDDGAGVFGTATTYTPSSADILAGQVILTLTTDDPSMAPFDATDCGPAMDEVLIIILKVDCGTFPWDGN